MSDCRFLEIEYGDAGEPLLNEDERNFLRMWNWEPFKIEEEVERMQGIINELRREITLVERRQHRQRIIEACKR